MDRAGALESDDLYVRLGVAPGATTEEIKRAYRALLREFPPERAPEQFKRLREAYETLGSPVTRREYDARPEPVVEQWLHLAIQALKDNEYSIAERYFKQVLLHQPDLLFVRNFLGLCFLYQGEAEKAVAQFERLLREPDAPAAWFANAAHAYAEVARYLDAEHAFGEALRRSSDNTVDYTIGLADVYLAQERYARAVKLLEDAIKADGTVDFQDLRYFTKLVETAIRERNITRVHDITRRMQQIAENEEQRRYLAWKLGTISTQLIAIGGIGGFTYGVPLAAAARRLQPADPDYFALEELGRVLQVNDFASAEELLAGHRSFLGDGWLVTLAGQARTYMDNNRAFAQLRPVSSAPMLRTLNGIGTKLYGERQHDARSGSFVTTLYLVILFIPVIPLACYRVIRSGNGWRFLGSVPYSKREYRHWAASLAAFVFLILWATDAARSSEAPDNTRLSTAEASTGSIPPSPDEATAEPVRTTADPILPPVAPSTEPPEPACSPATEWEGREGPRSGVERRRPSVRGYGFLTVTNGSQRNAIVVLQPLLDDGEARAMFVHKGEAGTFTRVAMGNYRVQFAMGDDLDAESWRFCGAASYSQFDDIVDFKVIRTEAGVRYSTFKITLHPVAGGNAKDTGIPASAFVVPDP